MFIKDFKECREFVAGDATVLREFLHPDKMDIALRYSLAHATLKPGKVSTPHALKTSEVYYILKGEAIMRINDESAKVFPGQVIYIPPNSRQSIRNCGKTDLKFLCIVDPAWQPEDEVVF
jgi:mannose-6-phosphate isomerase-like protein (cupin superfamily)